MTIDERDSEIITEQDKAWREPAIGKEEPGEETERPEDASAFLEELPERMSATKSPEVGRDLLLRIGQLCTEAAQSGRGHLVPGSLAAVVREFEAIPDLETLQEQALRVLEEIGAIYRSPEGAIVARLDRIKMLGHEDIHRFGQLHKSKYYGNKQKYPALFYAFKDRRVISEQDYHAGEREGKPLFYSPASEEEAFDVERIKQADFYLGLWDVGGLVYSGQSYPSIERGTDFTEVALACLIYHPQYGNGYRNEQGKLLVYNQESEEYQPASAEKLFRGNLGLKSNAHIRPAEYIMDHLPDLNRSGLLVPEDIEVRPALGTERPYYIRRLIGPKGSVMIDKVQYYVGKQEEFQGAEVYKIADDLAVIRKDGKITHTFKLRAQGDPALIPHSYTKGGKKTIYYWRTRKEDTLVTPYNQDEFLEKKADETDQEYEARAVPVENFELWSKLDRAFGEKGALNPFRSMELEPGQANKILSVSRKMDPQLMAEVIDSYQKVVRSAREIASYVRESLGAKHADERVIHRVTRHLMKRSLDLLLRYGENPPSPDQIRLELADLQSEVLLFAATFKGLKGENQPIRLEDFAKFKVEVRQGMQITPDERDRMKTMIVQNRMDRPDIIGQAEAEFETALASPNSSFYLLKYGDDLVGFFRMDRQGELDAYIGSLNVPRQIQGSGLGDEALKTYFRQALMGRVGHASADPRNPITPLYIGRYQFVGSGIKQFGETGRPFIEMTLDPGLNSTLEYLNAPDEKIVSAYQHNGYEIGQNQIILRFSEAELDSLMAESETILASGQYLMSAFRRITAEEEKNIYAVFELKPNLIQERREVA